MDSTLSCETCHRQPKLSSPRAKSLDVADSKPLTGLLWEKAEELIEEECQARKVSLTPQQRKRLVNLTWGLPLPIKLGIARMASGESFVMVDRWLGDAVGELPEYCAKGQIDLVRERDPNAWTVLLACSLFDREAGASREALGAIADLSLADRDKALAHLQRLFLVNHTDVDRFWVLPIVQRFARAAFMEQPQMHLIVQRWLEWLTTFALDWGGDLGRNIDRLPKVELEYPNLLAGIRWCRDQRVWNTLLTLAENVWEYAYVVGSWSDADAILDLAMEAARVTENEPKEGWVEVRRGRLSTMRDHPQALEHLDRAIAITERYDDRRELTTRACRRKEWVLRRRGDLLQSEALARRELALARQLNDPYAMVQAAEGLPRSKPRGATSTKPRNGLTKVNSGRNRHTDHGDIPAILYRKAVNLMKQGRYEEAEAPLLVALELNSRWKGTQYIALDKFRLAEVYANTDRPHLARRYAEEARDLYERLGMTERQIAAEQLLCAFVQHSIPTDDLTTVGDT